MQIRNTTHLMQVVVLLVGLAVTKEIVTAPDHPHFFNYRIDFDVDGENISFMRARMVPTKVEDDVPRKSI
jgi:Cu2+-containing amine oxidase